MIDAATMIFVSMTALFVTSMDNVAILVTLYARFRGRGLLVTLAYIATTALVVVAAYLLGEAAARVPVNVVGLLGFVPIAIGLYWLYGLMRERGPGPPATGPALHGRVIVLTSVASLIGNSVDTLLTMAVIFADSNRDADGLVLLGALGAAAILAGVSSYAVAHSAVGPVVERYSRRFAPFVMIGIGLYVLANTATDILPAETSPVRPMAATERTEEGKQDYR